MFLLTPLALAMTAASLAQSGADETQPIGPTPIKFYTGNLSVARFVHYWRHPGVAFERSGEWTPVNQATVDVMKRCSCTEMVDYIAWCVAEEAEGTWDFGSYEYNAAFLGERGVGYVPFCWLHFPPRWYLESDAFVPYVNLETGETIPQLSLWSPDLERVFDAFYAALSDSLGDEIDFIRLAMPTEYGEIGYCSGMTDWLVPQENAQPGYWCGGGHALAQFREVMAKRYENIDALNAAWGTGFASFDGIEMPDPEAAKSRFDASAGARRHWISFIDWYNLAWDRCLADLTGVVRRHFPDQAQVASLGYGSERACYGNDQSRYIATMAQLGVACQSPGAIGHFPTRRVSSACRFYGVPYYGEPPGDVPPRAQLDRLYMDVSNGTEVWFDYLNNLDRARGMFRQYKHLLTGAPPITPLAIWHPTADHWLHPEDAWSQDAATLSPALRDRADFEIIDDRMILDGALGAMNIRHLVLAGATWLDGDAWRVVQEWVKAGNVLTVLQETPIATVDGDAALWEAQAPEAPPKIANYQEGAIRDVPAAYALPMGAGYATSYLLGPWHDAGHEVRWSHPGSGVSLPMAPSTEYVLRIAASLPEAARPVDILLGDELLGRWEPGESGDKALAFRSRAGDEPYAAQLRFTGPGWTPADVQDSPDTRVLGLYVRSIEVREAGAEGAAVRPPEVGVSTNLDALWNEALRPLGQGAVLTLEPGGVTPAQAAAVLVDLLASAGERQGGSIVNLPVYDPESNGILATRFEDKLLYFNPSGEDMRIELAFRPGDFAGGRRPGSWTMRLDMPARTIREVPLKEE